MKGVRLVALGLLAGVAGGAAAQAAKSDFPNRPLRYIVPFPPGGATDLVARVVSVPLAEELGRQVVVDNRSGAAGAVGAEIAAKATPDGYTIFACNIASLAVSPALYKKLNYDPVASFAPIGLIGSTRNALAVHPSVPAKRIAEFIALAKSRPGKINYASAGVGTSRNCRWSCSECMPASSSGTFRSRAPGRRWSRSSAAMSRRCSRPCRRIRGRCARAEFVCSA
jgi:tripartite-type tricarboxylate transporter receptor subunit TctC